MITFLVTFFFLVGGVVGFMLGTMHGRESMARESSHRHGRCSNRPESLRSPVAPQPTTRRQYLRSATAHRSKVGRCRPVEQPSGRRYCDEHGCPRCFKPGDDL